MTKNEIRNALLSAKRFGDTHVIIVCDTFDHMDYPVDVRKVVEQYNGKNMQRVQEVYSLCLDIGS